MVLGCGLDGAWVVLGWFGWSLVGEVACVLVGEVAF